MKYLYDAKTNAFYPLALEADYVATGTWPEEGVEVDEATFAQFQTPPKGKIRVAGDNGYPVWADIPPLTHDQLVQIAENEQRSRIADANNFMNNKQWPGKAVLGRLKGDELAQYNTWLDYLDALEVVDVTTAPEITWPEQPAV